MASFSACHPGGTVAGDQLVLGTSRAERRRHALGRIEFGDEGADHGADLLVGRHERPGARIHEQEGAHEVGAAQDGAHHHPAAHGMAEEVDGTAPCDLEEGDAVGHQLLDAVGVDAPDLARVTVAALVECDDPALGRQGVDLQREVVGGAGEPVHEHKGGSPGRAAPPLGPRQIDAVDLHRLCRGRLCHGPCLAARPVRSLGCGAGDARGVQWVCGMQRSSYSAMTISPASGPQAGQAGSRRTFEGRGTTAPARRRPASGRRAGRPARGGP